MNKRKYSTNNPAILSYDKRLVNEFMVMNGLFWFTGTMRLGKEEYIEMCKEVIKKL